MTIHINILLSFSTVKHKAELTHFTVNKIPLQYQHKSSLLLQQGACKTKLQLLFCLKSQIQQMGAYFLSTSFHLFLALLYQPPFVKVFVSSVSCISLPFFHATGQHFFTIYYLDSNVLKSWWKHPF